MSPAQQRLDDEPNLAVCFHDSSIPQRGSTPPRHSGIYRQANPSLPRLHDGPSIGLTSVAAHAHTVADTVRAAFGAVQLGGLVVELTVPEQTTNGGLLALQHVVLRSPAGLSLVVGAVNVVEKYAELRSYEFVRRACELRFQTSPTFDAVAYRALLEQAGEVFENFALAIRIADPWEDLAAPPPVASHGTAPHLARATFYAACVVASAAIIVALIR